MNERQKPFIDSAPVAVARLVGALRSWAVVVGALAGAACGGEGPTQPAAATQLTFTVPPSNTVAGASIAPAVHVTARDRSGNTATQFTGTVTVALGANPSGGTLTGTTSVAAVSG